MYSSCMDTFCLDFTSTAATVVCVFCVQHSLLTLFICFFSRSARGGVWRRDVSQQPFIRSWSLVLPLHLCSDEGLKLSCLWKESLKTNPSLWTKRNYALIQEPSLHLSVIPSRFLSHSAPSRITASFPFPTTVTVQRPMQMKCRWVMLWTVQQFGVSRCACWTCCLYSVGCGSVKIKVLTKILKITWLCRSVCGWPPAAGGSRCERQLTVRFYIRSYDEWCQTTSFLFSKKGRIISSPRLRSLRGLDPRQTSVSCPATTLQSVCRSVHQTVRHPRCK